MAFQNSQSARLYYGRLALAAYSRSASTSHSVDMLDVSTLADTSKVFVPGPDTGTFTASGPTPVDNLDLFQTLLDIYKTAVVPPITYLPLGNTNNTAWLVDSRQTSFETSASHSSTVDWSLNAQVTGITDINGVVLENNTTVTATTDGTAHNNGAATTNGAVFHLHTTAFTGLTSNAVTIEGSTTGAFAGEETTVATFTTITSAALAFGLGAERVEVTGSVPRYVRAVDTIVGTGSTTRFVAYARR